MQCLPAACICSDVVGLKSVSSGNSPTVDEVLSCRLLDLELV